MSLCWYFSKSDVQSCTPSRKDGIDIATETRYRREGAKLIITASTNMGLRYDTQATSVVFFHRFFMLQSFKQFNRWVVAMSCLLLAGKVEETPKKSRDILKQAKALLLDHQFAKFGNDPREELLTHERILLQTIKFDLQVDHPYSYILKFGKQLKGDKVKLQKIVQMAWTFVNDSLCTTLCLQWESPAIAIAFLYLAAKLSKYDLQAQAPCKTKSWWRQFLDTVDVHDLEEISTHVLDLYGDKEVFQESEKSNQGLCAVYKDQESIVAASSKGEVVTPGTTQLASYHYPITTNASYSSQQSNMQPQGIMQMQQPVMQAQQAGTPTAMQAQNPVMPIQQATGMPVQQPMFMQQMQQPNMTMPQSLMPVQQQTVMPPTQQSAVVHGHQPTTLQLHPQEQQQQQQQAGGVSTPLSSIPLSQRIPLLPTPLAAGSPSSIPVSQQQMIQQAIPSVSPVNTATHYSSTSYVTHNTQ